MPYESTSITHVGIAFEKEGGNHQAGPMNRRKFLKSAASATAIVAGSSVAPGILNGAKAQSRQETLLVVTESGPNNFDIHGVGATRPGYEVSWNCYDRLISHGKKTLPNGVESYDRDVFVPELAEDFTVGERWSSICFRI